MCCKCGNCKLANYSSADTVITSEIVFRKSDPFGTISFSPSGLSAIVRLSYISNTDTRMTTAADFAADVELQGAKFTCGGFTSATIHLEIAGEIISECVSTLHVQQ